MIKKYIDIYCETGFERIQLFEAIYKRYRPVTVLYPGSSVHISPSFIFQNVTYVDPSALASEFFSRSDELSFFLEKEAHYIQKPCYNFLAYPVEDCPSLIDESFDLVFTSFSGNMIYDCWKYLKIGGVYICNNHKGELTSMADIQGAEYNGYFIYINGRYTFTMTEDLESFKEPPVIYKSHKNGRISYLKNDLYYVIYKKLKG